MFLKNSVNIPRIILEYFIHLVLIILLILSMFYLFFEKIYEFSLLDFVYHTKAHCKKKN